MSDNERDKTSVPEPESGGSSNLSEPASGASSRDIDLSRKK